MNKTLNKIKEKVKKYAQKALSDINPVYAPTNEDIINIVDKYWMSRYAKSGVDNQGRRKIFFNVVENPVLVAGKMIDVDTKDIKIQAANNKSVVEAWFLEKDLKMWLKENKISKFLNKAKYWLPKYGTIIAKKVISDGNIDIDLVPLQNFYVEADVDSIEDSEFIIEEHEYLLSEVRKLGEKRNWDNIDELFEEVRKENRNRPQKAKTDKVTIFEFYDNTADRGGDNYFIVADIKKGITLHNENKNEIPYKELHWDKQAGRWLGIGQVEKTFEAQIHLNRVMNMKDSALEWTSKLVFQTRDQSLGKNLLTEVANGKIIFTRDEITQVANEERNLSAYREEEELWLNNIQQRSFATDVVRGQRVPAGTPAASAILSSQQASGFFNQKRKEFGIFLKDIIVDWIIPYFEKEKSKEHILRFISDDPEEMKRIDRLMLNTLVNRDVLDFAFRNDTFPMPSQIEFFRRREADKLKQSEERFVKMVKDAYKDIEYKVDVVVTGESVDIDARMRAIQTALQTTQDPAERRQLINRMLQALGEAPNIRSSEKRLQDILGEVTQQQQQGSPPRIRGGQGTPMTTQRRTQV